MPYEPQLVPNEQVAVQIQLYPLDKSADSAIVVGLAHTRGHDPHRNLFNLHNVSCAQGKLMKSGKCHGTDILLQLPRGGLLKMRQDKNIFHNQVPIYWLHFSLLDTTLAMACLVNVHLHYQSSLCGAHMRCGRACC